MHLTKTYLKTDHSSVVFAWCCEEAAPEEGFLGVSGLSNESQCLSEVHRALHDTQRTCSALLTLENDLALEHISIDLAKRMFWVPFIVPMSPHGRLIDAYCTLMNGQRARNATDRR